MRFGAPQQILNATPPSWMQIPGLWSFVRSNAGAGQLQTTTTTEVTWCKNMRWGAEWLRNSSPFDETLCHQNDYLKVKKKVSSFGFDLKCTDSSAILIQKSKSALLDDPAVDKTL